MSPGVQGGQGPGERAVQRPPGGAEGGEHSAPCPGGPRGGALD